jgi:hypothetical protein
VNDILKTMDVVIPSHNIKTLSSSLSALAKVDKFVYIEFDPLEGLRLRSISCSKSSFCQFTFDVGFFERCSSPPSSKLKRSGKRSRGNLTDDDDVEEKYLCRVLIRTIAAVLRGGRKGVQSLRIRSLGHESAYGDENDDDSETSNNRRMQLAFEFKIQSSGIMKVIHKIGVIDADAVVAVATRENCSEIVALPRVLLKMVEPVKSNEIAFIISDANKKVSVTSFHYADNSSNLVLSSSFSSALKTETTMESDEFDEFNYSDYNKEDDVPAGVDKEVTLVFSCKEAKAMLQFCAQSSVDDELRVIVSFHWGGKPICFEAEGDAYKGEMILATVAHNLLSGVDLISGGGKKN